MSGTVGFVAQMKGILTIRSYRIITDIVAHYSQLGYVYLQKDSSSKEMFEDKQAFKLFACEHGITVQHCHAENG
jgi:hypothetical protein